MKTRAFVTAGVVALGFGAWWLTRPAPAAPPAHAPVSTGSERTWRVSVRGHAELPLAPSKPAVPSDVVTTGVLRVRGYGADANGFQQLGLSLASLDEATMTLGSTPAMQDRAALEAALTGGEAVLTLRPEGDLVDLDFTPGSHNVFRSFAQTVAGELQLPVRDGASWTLLDTTLRGKAEATYARTATGFHRARTRYAKLTAFGDGLRDVTVAAETSWVTSAAGLQSVRSTEVLEGVTPDGVPVVSTLELTLEPLGAVPLVAALPTQLDDSEPGRIDRPADMREQFLAQRVDGLTPQQLMEGVMVHGTGASPQAIAEFLPRASGLLLQQPELCAVLAERAKNARTPVSERTFALEVLAAAGSPEAQAAMRDILSSDAMRADPNRRERFQRLSLLVRPTKETVAFVDDAWRQGTPDERRTLSLVLGATAGQLARSGDEAAASPFVTELSQALRSASDAKEREYLVGALGNVGLEQSVPDVVAALEDSNAAMRTQAVLALRKTPVPEARRAVTQALQDPEVSVQAAALEVLLRWTPDAAERAALVEGLRSGRLSPALGHQVLNALAPFAGEPDVRAALAWLSTQPAADPSLQRRARVLAGGAL